MSSLFGLFLACFLSISSHGGQPVARAIDPGLAAQIEKVTGLAYATAVAAVLERDKAATAELLKYLAARGTGPLLEDARAALKKASAGDERKAHRRAIEQLKKLVGAREAPGRLAEKTRLAVLVYREQVLNEVLKRNHDELRVGCLQNPTPACQAALSVLSAAATAVNELATSFVK